MKSFNKRGGRPEEDREPRRAYKATCSECNKMCDVPFKPNGSKPVLCNACFNRDDSFDQKRTRGRKFDRPSFGDNRSRGQERYGGDVSEQLRAINAKLDTILRAIR